MTAISDILAQWGDDTVAIIQRNMASAGTNASGETSQSLRSDLLSETRVQVSGKPFLNVVETGRRPGKQPPVSKIIKWLETGKVSFEGTIESTAWAISKKIASSGSSLFRSGGRDDIIQPAISDARIDELTNNIADASLGLTVSTIDDFLDGNPNTNE